MSSLGKSLLIAVIAIGLSGPVFAQPKADAGSGPTTGATSTNDAGSGPAGVVTLPFSECEVVGAWRLRPQCAKSPSPRREACGAFEPR